MLCVCLSIWCGPEFRSFPRYPVICVTKVTVTARAQILSAVGVRVEVLIPDESHHPQVWEGELERNICEAMVPLDGLPTGKVCAFGGSVCWGCLV